MKSIHNSVVIVAVLLHCLCIERVHVFTTPTHTTFLDDTIDSTTPGGYPSLISTNDTFGK